ISVLEGSGGNIAVLTGPDGKVLIDGGIGASRPQLTKALADLGTDPISHLLNTHWHFDHTSGNERLHAAGARIIAQENTRKYLSEVQRVEDWDYNFLPLRQGGIPSEVFAAEHTLKLQRRHHPTETLHARAHRQRHLRDLWRGGRPAYLRYLLEWHLSFHR